MSTKDKIIKTAELEIRVLPNDIHIYKLTDWSENGLNQWEESVMGRLDQATDIVLSIYDMRHLSTISRSGFAVANRISVHPKIDLAYSVAVLSNRRVAILVNTLIQMRRNGENNRILSDLDEAVRWLTQHRKPMMTK